MIQLDIISDPICPWCYIGKTRLDRAIATAGKNPFHAAWRMFRLNPDMPPEGMDRRAYLEAKFGGAENAERVYRVIADAAKAEGLALDMERIARTPQTLDAHRLIRWARMEGAEGPVVNQIFRSYFENGEDISDHAVLIWIGTEASMDGEVLERLLASDADREELLAEEQTARRMGVNGVPCFIIDSRHVVQGAQDGQTWSRVIQELTGLIDQPAQGARL